MAQVAGQNRHRVDVVGETHRNRLQGERVGMTRCRVLPDKEVWA